MRIKLTPTNVPKLLPSGSDYFDMVAPGLVLRVRTSGARTYAAVYSWRGRSLRVTIGPTHRWELADARLEAKRVLRLRDVGTNPSEARRLERAPAPTIEKLLEGCLEAIAVRPGTAQEYRRLADVEVLPQLGQLQAPLLARARIREWSRAIAARGAPYVANRAFALLRRVYAWAVSEDLVEASPFYGLKAPAPERASDRVLSVPELRALLLALEDLPGQYSDAVELLLLTGTRREMVVGMRDGELDLEAREPRWVVPSERVKGGRPHVVPLSDAAIAVIQRRLDLVDDYCFPPIQKARSYVMSWSGKYVQQLRDAMLKRLQERQGADVQLPRWTIHDLRRVVATHMVEDLGIQTEVVSLILSHQLPGAAVTRVYQRAERLAERRVALLAWADWLAAVRAGEAAKIVPLRPRHA